MGLKKLSQKLDAYFERLERGKATQIEPAHVQKVIAKLQAKQNLLTDEFLAAQSPSKKERLSNKLATARAQIERAQWLLAKIGS